MTIEKIQGKQIEIRKMVIERVDNQLEMSWTIYVDNEIYNVVFHNISGMKIEKMSSPLEIQGCEMITHVHNGWDKGVKYEIRDFENDCINFFCEELNFSVEEKND